MPGSGGPPAELLGGAALYLAQAGAAGEWRLVRAPSFPLVGEMGIDRTTLGGWQGQKLPHRRQILISVCQVSE